MLDGMSVSTAVRDQMPNDHVAAVVLAAGKGTRMKSILPKVLHPLAGRPMILHLLDTVHTVGVERAVVVVGPEGENVAEAVAPALIAVQEEALGTGHAVMSARAALAGFTGHVLVRYGDKIGRESGRERVCQYV